MYTTMYTQDRIQYNTYYTLYTYIHLLDTYIVHAVYTYTIQYTEIHTHILYMYTNG